MSGREPEAFLRERLVQAFSPERLDILNESHKHAGHTGNVTGGGHFQVTIVSAAFEGKRLIERHRMVYEAVGNAMQNEIHALGIKALTPEEDRR